MAMENMDCEIAHREEVKPPGCGKFLRAYETQQIERSVSNRPHPFLVFRESGASEAYSALRSIVNGSRALSRDSTIFRSNNMQVAQQAFQSFRRMFLVRGIIAVVFGVLALVLSPGITLLFLVYLFGAFAFIGGIAAAALALRYTRQEGWALLLVEGILGIVVGVVAFAWPGITAFALLFLIAAWAIVTGIIQIVTAFTMPQMGAGREWLLGLSGLASVIFGVLIAVWPIAGLVTVVWLIGIYAIVFGVLFITRYFQTRSMAASL